MKVIFATALACVFFSACSAEDPKVLQSPIDQNPRPNCGGLAACLPPVRPLPDEFKLHALDTLQLQATGLAALAAYHQGSDPEDASTAALVRLLRNARCAKESVTESDGTVVKKISSPNCPVGSELTSRVATKDSTTKEDASALFRVFGQDYLGKGKLRFLTSETQSVANTEDLASGLYRVDLNGGDSGSLELADGEKLEFQGSWIAEATVGSAEPQPRVLAYKGTLQSRLRFPHFEAILLVHFERSENGRVLAEALLNGEKVAFDRSNFVGQIVHRMNDDAVRAVQSRGL